MRFSLINLGIFVWMYRCGAFDRDDCRLVVDRSWYGSTRGRCLVHIKNATRSWWAGFSDLRSFPLIYTISEDALQSVPQHLRSASLGCGATTWQTTIRVVVPTAMSGLFSAMMIGFGRAVGETMVVLMAAGNTPVMDINPMNGYRTLSATLATELPEAARGADTFSRTVPCRISFVLLYADCQYDRRSGSIAFSKESVPIVKTPKRATSTGQSLISQGEPMVWLTGGMFAIACCMIFALIGLILYKGLATHWQRPFAVYPLLNGDLEAGELQYQQTFNITQQSLSQLDDASRAKAANLLKGAEQTDSSQLYLRTGNYDVTNRHFAFLPEVTLNIDSSAFRSNRVYMPEEVWLLERREWGVMYGFPTRLEQNFSPELSESYSRLKLLLDNLETIVPENGADE